MKSLKHFILAIIILACKKTDIEEEPVQFPSTIYLNSITLKSKIRLFSDQKEIKDQKVIDHFAKTFKDFEIRDTSFNSDEKLIFLSPDSASIPNLFGSLNAVKIGDQFLFKSTNINIITAAQLPNYKMAKYQSEIEPVWDSKYRVYHMLIGYGDYTALKLSAFKYSSVHWNTYLSTDFLLYPFLYKSSSSGIRYNEFNESYIANIGKSDTLAIQEYFYTFKKK